MADADGRPRPELRALYRELVEGGVGLIVSGHLYVHPSGKAHPEMTGIHADDLIPDFRALCDAVHDAGGHIAAQINHGGMQCSRKTVDETVAPSAIDAPFLDRRPRALASDEIVELIEAFAAAARRAQEAGFDAVQIHAAHGYLVNQFLSPYTNHRSDAYGPSEGGADAGSDPVEGRTRFLAEICLATRRQVGPHYPLFIKLGMTDGVEGGLTPESGARIAARLEGMGLDAVEISGGIGGGESFNTRGGIRTPADEAYFRPLAQRARRETALPIALVGGLRSLAVMEDVVRSGDADLVSMCRPLICEPDLPRRFRREEQERAQCTTCGQCWPDAPGEGIACVLSEGE
jgi:2,4-dienoyl-CoA reductase-like NADH-dependent reductase (Old Yellow Enzyme family)